MDVFLVLKPLCDSFMNKPSANKATEIVTLINRTPNIILQKIYENVLYPIIHHLKNNALSKDENCKLIEAIHAIISKIRMENLKLFYVIYHALRMQICEQNNITELIDAHEELKQVTVVCLKDLVKNSSISVIESFYTRQHAALLSHGIYLCIKIARLEKSTSLRLAALEAVMTLLQVHQEADMSDIVLCNQIADVIMLYLPGVAKGLLEVILGSDIQHHKITMLAIRVWSRVMTLVMQDMPLQETTTDTSLILENIIKSKDLTDLEQMKHILETAKRTPEWYITVSEKFKTIFAELHILTKHSHSEVRKELAEGVGLLLLSSTKNIRPCFQTLLEIMITLSEDECDEVAQKAEEVLQQIQDKCLSDKNLKTVIEIMEENLYDLLTKMPRAIRTSGESLQIVWLNRLAGYLKILGKERLSHILLSTAHLRKLLLTLVYIAELDCRDVSLLEGVTTTADFEQTMYRGSSYSWKQFKFLFDAAAIEKLYVIFRTLGRLGDQKMLIDSILKMTLDVPKFKKELTLILNTILEVPTCSTIQIPIYKEVIDHYTAPNHWNLPIKVSDEVTLQAAQNNIIQCCLLLEGLGVIAKVLKNEFQHFLLKTLYIVIERAGSEQTLLRFIGLSTLEMIAKSQNLSSIGDLFRTNIDYISYHVTMKLRRVERNPGVLDVVEVVTNYSTIDFLPHLKDIVDDLLVQSGIKVQKCNSQSFLKVFYAFAICVKRFTLKQEGSIEKENEMFFQELRSLKPAETIINNILEYQTSKINSETYNHDEEVTSDIDETLHDDFNEKDIKVPQYINMIRDIMKRCLHFVPSQDFTESSLSMSILKEGASILKDWENELLPIVHEIWHPLVERFHNSNPLVINQAWQLLCCLARVSQNFIRSRTLKQILPILSDILQKASKESYKKDTGCTYKYTQIFKLQKEILTQLGSVVKNLKLREKETWNILDITELYLDIRQNTELQEYCVNMYKDIGDYNPDIVWIKCIDIWNRYVEYVIPETDLNHWYLKVLDCDTKSIYQENVLKILMHVYEKCKYL